MEEAGQGRPRRKRRQVEKELEQEEDEQKEQEGEEEESPPKRRRKQVTEGKGSGESFRCDACPATSFLRDDTSVRKHRHFQDKLTGRKLSLCNACGLKYKRRQSQKKPQEKKAEEEVGPESSSKAEYLGQGLSFGQEIAILVGEEAAARFYCPKYRGGSGCGCLQGFMQSPGMDQEETVKRVQLLLRYHRKAEELLQQGTDPGSRPGSRSSEFEEFVLTNRDYLKSQLRLCEPAVQRVLQYSNNFLYKVTAGQGQRVVAQTAGSLQVQSVEASKLLEEHSLSCGCQTTSNLQQSQVEEWRSQSLLGQAGRREVVREMVERLGLGLCRGLVQQVSGLGVSAISRQITQLRRETS